MNLDQAPRSSTAALKANRKGYRCGKTGSLVVEGRLELTLLPLVEVPARDQIEPWELGWKGTRSELLDNTDEREFV